MTEAAQVSASRVPAPRISVPRISVIVPIYNVAAHIRACIRSILDQSFTDFELIAVDDGSTDDSGLLATQEAGGDPRFQLISQPNGGLSRARNTGLARARGPLVAFVDSDDRVAPTYLERLETTLRETGADWVACGILFCPEDGTKPTPHPAIHGVPDMPADRSPRRIDLSDWTQVVRHFPSAWNKLYRRNLMADLRFDEGLNYEDHAFFYRYACRSDHFVHLPEPLYISTQGRPGQITRDGSERVFEQFDVLEILRAIVAGSDKSGGARALAQITTRLTFERSQAITDPDRRARFIVASRTAQAATGLPPDPTLGVAMWWVSLLEGHVPVSVIIPSDGDGAALNQSLAALQARSLPEAEVLVVADGAAAHERLTAMSLPAGARLLQAPGGDDMETCVALARNAGLDVAQGEAVVFLDAGDTLPPRALAIWHNRLRRAGAQIGFAGFVLLPDTAHSGLHDKTGIGEARLSAPEGFAPTPRDALFIHAHPSAKIFERAFLLAQGLRFRPTPLSSWQLLFAAIARADRVLYLSGPPARLATRPACRKLWQHPVQAADLTKAIHTLQATPPDAARLMVRAIWEKLNFAIYPDAATRATFEDAALSEFARFDFVQQHGPAAVTCDGFVGARIRQLLALGDKAQD